VDFLQRISHAVQPPDDVKKLLHRVWCGQSD